MGFAERKKDLFEIDAKWNIKLALRMLMNLICIVSIIMAVMTIKKTNTTKFQPTPFLKASTVLVYIPCDAITIVWNMFNIVRLIVKKKTVSHWVNTMMHFILGFGFAVVGIYVTIVAYNGYKDLGLGQIYNTDGGSYQTSNVRGQQVLINATNTIDCPAFSDCQDQAFWIAGARKRSLISVIGCCLFDLVFVLHCLFFLWCMSDSVFGLRGRSQRELQRDDLRSRRKKNLVSPMSISAESLQSIAANDMSTVSDTERLGTSDGIDIEMLAKHGAVPIGSGLDSTTINSHKHSLSRDSMTSWISMPPTQCRDSLSLSIFDSSHPMTQRPFSSSPYHRVSVSKLYTHGPISAGANTQQVDSGGASALRGSIRAPVFSQDLQQQQHQEQLKHQSGTEQDQLQHAPHCTCGQGMPRSSLSSVTTYQSQSNRRSSAAESRRQSHCCGASQAARSTTNRTSSLFSGVSGTSSHSSAGASGPSPPLQNSMPPVPPIPQPFVSNAPLVKSSLRQSLSASEVSRLSQPPPVSPNVEPLTSVQGHRRRESNDYLSFDLQQIPPSQRASLAAKIQQQQLQQQKQLYLQHQMQQKHIKQQQTQQQQRASMPLNHQEMQRVRPLERASVGAMRHRQSQQPYHQSDLQQQPFPLARTDGSLQQVVPDLMSPTREDITALPAPRPAAKSPIATRKSALG